MSSRCRDVIRVRDRLLNVSLDSGSRWPAKSGQSTLQPISLSVDIVHDISSAGASDDLSLSINYSHVSKLMESALTHISYPSIEDILHRALSEVHEVFKGATIAQIKIRIVQLKPPLHCKTVGLEAWSSLENGTWETSRTRHFVTDFVRPTIVGINDVEREEEQSVVVNISVETQAAPLRSVKLDFRKLTRTLWKGIGKTSYLTLEALTTYVAKETLIFLTEEFASDVEPLVTVAAAKPCALVYADASEVEITRIYDDFHIVRSSRHSKAVIAFGSNLEDRFFNIEYALCLLEDPSSLLPDAGPQSRVSVIDTSFLYETAPMYVTEQPAFINGACLVETNLEPELLLQLLKAIESKVGRTPTIRNGPRIVDLDIIFYDDLILDTRAPSLRSGLENLIGQLVIPHPRVQEREFALRPIADMMPDYVHPVLHSSVRELLESLPRAADEAPMSKVIPFPDHSTYSAVEPPATLTYWLHPTLSPCSNPDSERQTKTRLMSTLNVTPDSFSDGSEHNTCHTASAYARESVSCNADIIDIGGYSTRPGAAPVDANEETRRIVPIIQALRSDSGCSRVLLSVDTFRSNVAAAALEAGANVINDVYAFTGPCGKWRNDEEALKNMNQMKATARQYCTPVVLMHSRADAGKDKDYSAYAYAEKTGTPAIVEGVRVELGEKVEQIIKGKGGVRRWLVIADPGIGFSKTVEDNLKLLRHGAKVVDDVKIGGGEQWRNPLSGLPTLVGTSRKSFIGSILAKGDHGRQTTPKERVWATATGVACAIQQGVMVVRVHDVKEMADVVTMADSLWL